MQLANLVAQNTDVVGTGNATLTAGDGRTFQAAFPENSAENPFRYFIFNDAKTEIESGLGYILNTSGDLVRQTPDGGVLVNFSAGNKTVTCDAPASLQEQLVTLVDDLAAKASIIQLNNALNALNKNSVGLGEVDNTSDPVKPLSVQQKAYIDQQIANLRNELDPSGDPPTIVDAPVLSGSTVVGQFGSLSTGVWNNAPTSFIRQWYRDGAVISGATGENYLFSEDDVGHDIKGGVIASNSEGPSEEVFSNVVNVISSAPLRTIAVQNRIFSFNESFTGLSGFCGRTGFEIGTDANDMLWSLNGWVFTNTGYHTLTDPYTIDEMWVFAPNNIGVQVKWNGVGSKTINPGDVDIQSDPLFPADFGLITFAKNDIYWVKVKGSMAAGKGFPTSSFWVTGNTPGSQTFFYNPANTTVSPAGTAGTFSTTGTAPTSRTSTFSPLMFGHPVIDGDSFGSIGDSIHAGFGDSGGSYGGLGFFQRAVQGDGGADTRPGLNLSIGGTNAGHYVGNTQTAALFKYAKIWGENFAANDLSPSDPVGSLTTLKSRKQTLWSSFRSNGAVGVYSTAPFFRVTSSNGFLDADGQSYYSSPWEPGAQADQLEAWLDTKQDDGTIDHVIDTIIVRDPTQTRKVKTNNVTPNAWTPDGVHLRQQGNIDMKTIMAPIFRNFLVDLPVPVNTVAPVVSGTIRIGETISTTTGSWNNSPTSYAYQWRRNGTNISGANDAAYVLVTADLGTTVTCAVTASNATGPSASPSISNGLVINVLPINTVAPVASGNNTVGSLLSCTTGTWDNSPTSYAYQWKRDGVNIGGATSSTYTSVMADNLHTVTCAVTATNANGPSAAAAVSNGISVSNSLSPPVSSVAPVVSGTVTMGQNLSCSTGTWTNSPTGYTYQWRRAGVNISGATSGTYTLVLADLLKQIDCTVLASNGAGPATAAEPTSNQITPNFKSIPGLVLDEDSTLGVLDTTNNVYEWDDQSDNPINFIQTGSDTLKPKTNVASINGQNALQFGPTSELKNSTGLNSIANGSNSVWGIVKLNATTGDQKFISGSSTGVRWGLGFNPSGGTFFYASNATGGVISALSPVLDTNVHVIGGDRNGSVANAYYDDLVGPNAAASNVTLTAGVSIGKNANNSIGWLIGLNRKVLVWNRSLTAAEKNAVRSALAVIGGLDPSAWAPIT